MIVYMQAHSLLLHFVSLQRGCLPGGSRPLGTPFDVPHVMKKNKNPRSRRSRMLRIRVSEEEYTRLKKLAQESGYTLSELVRRHLLKKTLQARGEEQEKRLALTRFGTNLNQIARWVNMHRSGAEAVLVIRHLMELREEMKKWR